MYPDPNPLLARLAAGGHVSGLYVQTASADMVELAAAAGYDYVILDEEHGPFGFGETVQMIRAAEASGICPIVRVADQSPAAIRKALEAGAMGLYVPDVRTAGEARAAVAAARFHAPGHDGRRGACPTVRAARGRGADWADFVRWSNTNVQLTLLVESEEGLANIDTILAVPGIDVIVLGRFDLAHAMGLHGDRYGAEIAAVFEAFVRKAEAAGVRYVARIASRVPAEAAAEIAHWLARGARIFNVGSDRELVGTALRSALAPYRAASPAAAGGSR